MTSGNSISGNLLTQEGKSSVGVTFDSLIQDVTPLEGSTALLTAGLIDTHTHGGSGYALSADAESFDALLAHGRKHGVARTLLSTVSASSADILEILSFADQRLGKNGFLGIHLEGPFIAEERCGAHDMGLLRDLTDTELDQLLEHSSLKAVTIAPERVTTSKVEKLVEAGVRVALGHTDADYKTALDYFSAGASILTHAFNAMKPVSSRSPGPVVAALDAGAWIEVIADGVHVSPELCANLARWAGDRLLLVTDSMSAANMPDGHYSLGNVDVDVVSGVARRADDGTLAGSTLTLDKAVKNLIDWGVSPSAAVSAASTSPAACFGLSEPKIAPGLPTEIAVWSSEMELEQLILG